MAQPLTCDSDDGQLAAFMVTKLDDGETIALCGADMLEWCRMMSSAADGAPAGETSPTGDDAAVTSPSGDNGAGDGPSGGADGDRTAARPGPDDDSDEDEVLDAAVTGNGAAPKSGGKRKAAPPLPAPSNAG